MKKLLVIAASAIALTAASAGAPQYVGCSPKSDALRVCYQPTP